MNTLADALEAARGPPRTYADEIDESAAAVSSCDGRGAGVVRVAGAASAAVRPQVTHTPREDRPHPTTGRPAGPPLTGARGGGASRGRPDARLREHGQNVASAYSTEEHHVVHSVVDDDGTDHAVGLVLEQAPAAHARSGAAPALSVSPPSVPTVGGTQDRSSRVHRLRSGGRKRGGHEEARATDRSGAGSSLYTDVECDAHRRHESSWARRARGSRDADEDDDDDESFGSDQETHRRSPLVEGGIGDPITIGDYQVSVHDGPACMCQPCAPRRHVDSVVCESTSARTLA